MSETPLFDAAGQNYRAARIAHWDRVACKRDSWHGWSGPYHRRLQEIYSFLVSPGQRVLEIGCADGTLLASLRPGRGVGVDFSSEMLGRARKQHPDLEFVQADAHDLSAVQ